MYIARARDIMVIDAHRGRISRPRGVQTDYNSGCSARSRGRDRAIEKKGRTLFVCNHGRRFSMLASADLGREAASTFSRFSSSFFFFSQEISKVALKSGSDNKYAKLNNRN